MHAINSPPVLADKTKRERQQHHSYCRGFVAEDNAYLVAEVQNAEENNFFVKRNNFTDFKICKLPYLIVCSF
jgi:deoxycytidylate deaminase